MVYVSKTCWAEFHQLCKSGAWFLLEVRDNNDELCHHSSSGDKGESYKFSSCIRSAVTIRRNGSRNHSSCFKVSKCQMSWLLLLLLPLLMATSILALEMDHHHSKTISTCWLLSHSFIMAHVDHIVLLVQCSMLWYLYLTQITAAPSYLSSEEVVRLSAGAMAHPLWLICQCSRRATRFGQWTLCVVLRGSGQYPRLIHTFSHCGLQPKQWGEYCTSFWRKCGRAWFVFILLLKMRFWSSIVPFVSISARWGVGICEMGWYIVLFGCALKMGQYRHGGLRDVLMMISCSW